MATKMVLNRNYTMSTTLGHAVRFRKDEEVLVPASVVHEAVAIGALVVDGDANVVKGDDEVAQAKAEYDTLANNPVNREAALMTAIKKLVAKNERGMFDASARPHPKSLSKEAGFKVDAKERDVVWQKYIDQLATAEQSE